MSRGMSRRAWLAGGLAAGGALIGCSEPIPKGRQGVDLWFSYGGKNRQLLERLVAHYNESQAAIWVRPVFQGDYFECLAKLRTALAAGAAPALSHVVGEVVPYLAEANVLEPLSDYPGASELDFVPSLGQAGTWLGGAERPLVALPFNRSTPIAYLNGDLLKQARLEPPRSWDELAEVARALGTRGGARERWGFECPIDWWFWVALVGQAGGHIIEPSGELSLGGEAGAQGVLLWQRLVRDRLMRPPPGRDYNAWEVVNQDFLAGRAAMIWTSTAFLRYLEENARFPVLAAPLPQGARRAVPTGGTFFVVLRQAPEGEKRAAWEFLRWMNQAEQSVTWATGTGYLPVTKQAVSLLEARGYYREHPNDRVAYDQLEVAMTWPWSRSLFRVQREIIQPRLEQAVLTGSPAHQLLDEARALARRELGAPEARGAHPNAASGRREIAE